MNKQNNIITLPRISTKQKVHTQPSSLTSRNSFNKIPNKLKLQHLILKYQRSSSKQQKYKSNQKMLKCKQKIVTKISKPQPQEIESYIPPTQLVLYINKIYTDCKPPNRYKTAIGLSEGNIILYGGLGCEKNISWAKFQMKTKKWSKATPDRNLQNLQYSIYGHTLRIYKGNAYVFGGTRCESSTNQLILLSLMTMQSSLLPPAPFRRKQHAMTIISKFLVVQGGLQSTSVTKNQLFYFDIENNKWTNPIQIQLPFLSHHSMITIPNKTRKKTNTLQDILGQSIFMFGGLDQNGEESDRLYCFRTRQSGEIAAQKIQADGGPEARHSLCMEFIQPNYICIYGGRNNEELSGQNKKDGIFNDIFLFNIDKRLWIMPITNITLQYRYGASCCVSKNAMIIFGGNSGCEYSDGNIMQVSFRNQLDDKLEQTESNMIKTKIRMY